MFLIREPPAGWIPEVLESQRGMPFSYERVGTSQEGPARLDGFVVDHNRVRLGGGERTFDRAVAALRTWKMFDVGWARLVPDGAPSGVGTTVGVLAQHYGLWSLNVSRVIYAFDRDDGAVVRRGFAYGTLPEHAESGEERFTVEWNRDDDSVFYDLYAFSRPNHVLARLGRPVARGLQRRFARDSLRAMVQAARVLDTCP